MAIATAMLPVYLSLLFVDFQSTHAFQKSKLYPVAATLPTLFRTVPTQRLVSSLNMSDNNAQGGDGGVSQALNIIHQGTKLIRELDSKSVNPEEAEREALEEEKDIMQNGEALEEEKDIMQNEEEGQKDTPSTIVVSNQPNNNNNNITKANATRIDRVQQEIEQLFQNRLDAFDRRARRIRIIVLRKIAAWAFEVSDVQKRGKIDRAAFYSGTLLVHLHLAKYVGVAACQPPTREQIDELFHLADTDCSGFLDKKEFTNAVLVATAPITSRIAVYWTLLAILPLIVTRTMGSLTNVLEGYVFRGGGSSSGMSMSSSRFRQGLAVLQFIIHLILSRAFFSILLPNIFGKIDRAARRFAYKRARRRKTTTSLWWLGTTADSWSTWFREVGEAITTVQENWLESTTGSSSESSTGSSDRPKIETETVDGKTGGKKQSTVDNSSADSEEASSKGSDRIGKRLWMRLFAQDSLSVP